MNFVNELEEMQKQLRDMEQLKKAKHNLQVFLDSFEGDSKTATNTHAEESAVEYWKNILEKGKNDYERSTTHIKSQIEQATLSFEKTKTYIDQQLDQLRMNYERSVSHLKTQFEQTRVNHDKSMNHLQAQIQQCETNFAAQQQNIGSRLEKAKDNLQRKVSKKKPKQQLDLEITVNKLEESIKKRDDELTRARKEGRTL